MILGGPACLTPKLPAQTLSQPGEEVTARRERMPRLPWGFLPEGEGQGGTGTWTGQRGPRVLLWAVSRNGHLGGLPEARCTLCPFLLFTACPKAMVITFWFENAVLLFKIIKTPRSFCLCGYIYGNLSY